MNFYINNACFLYVICLFVCSLEALADSFGLSFGQGGCIVAVSSPGQGILVICTLTFMSWVDSLACSWTCLTLWPTGCVQSWHPTVGCIQPQMSDSTTDLLTYCWPDLLASPWTFHVTGGSSGSLDSSLSEGVIIKYASIATFRCLIIPVDEDTISVCVYHAQLLAPLPAKTCDSVFCLLLGLNPHLLVDSKKQDEALMVRLRNVYNKAYWHCEKSQLWWKWKVFFAWKVQDHKYHLQMSMNSILNGLFFRKYIQRDTELW